MYRQSCNDLEPIQEQSKQITNDIMSSIHHGSSHCFYFFLFSPFLAK